MHTCAELETDLARTAATYATAEPVWRLVGGDLTHAVCGMVTALTERRHLTSYDAKTSLDDPSPYSEGGCFTPT